MSFWGYKPYQSVAARLKKAEAVIAKAKKSGKPMSPIAAGRGAITKTFWGKAWCENLEHYSDYANRLPRGRSYARNGSVIDLRVAPGEVRAQVMGSALYKVTISVASLPETQWQAISTACAGSIDSLVELLQGQLSNAVMENICKPGSGLFPTPKEITFQCSCPDWADMCKHVAAVLFGIGMRLDLEPELLFNLRKVEVNDLVSHARESLSVPAKRPARGKVLEDAMLGDVFGIEMADGAPNQASASTSSKPHKSSAASKKTPVTKAVNAAKIVKATKTAKAIKAGGKQTTAKPVLRTSVSKADKTEVLATQVGPAAKTAKVSKEIPRKIARPSKLKPPSRKH